MGKFKFSSEQIENLKLWKNSLSSERAQNWTKNEDEAESITSKILNDENFKQGENLSLDQLDKLFSNMRLFSANRNLSKLLYTATNDYNEFNKKLRYLLHGSDPFPERINEFFKLKSIGIQTLSQFLVALDTKQYPFVTNITKDMMDISSEQDQSALEEAIEHFNIQNHDKLLDRTLDYLRDFITFQSVKNLLSLEKYTQVNNLLWFRVEQHEEGPEEVIKAYGSITIENDLRDYLAENIFVIEKGITLIDKEYDTKQVGRIDLLCKDKTGKHVVIELKKGRTSDMVVGQTLRYLGWVKENLNSNTRGIIIVNEPDERLEYALKPLSGLVELKFYKVNFEIKNEFEKAKSLV